MAALITSPIGPIVVYGTVVAYAHEPTHDDGRAARAWEVHGAEIDRQAADWLRLRERYPDLPVVVAGDMNQGRDGRRWSYGTAVHRAALTEAFTRAGLRSLTDVDLVETGDITERGHVEHIAVSETLELVGAVEAWDRRDAVGALLSDHPTLAVDLAVH